MSPMQTAPSFQNWERALQANAPIPLPIGECYLIAAASVDSTAIQLSLSDSGSPTPWPPGVTVRVPQGSRAWIVSSVAQTVRVIVTSGGAFVVDNRFAPGPGVLDVRLVGQTTTLAVGGPDVTGTPSTSNPVQIGGSGVSPTGVVHRINVGAEGDTFAPNARGIPLLGLNGGTGTGTARILRADPGGRLMVAQGTANVVNQIIGNAVAITLPGPTLTEVIPAFTALGDHCDIQVIIDSSTIGTAQNTGAGVWLVDMTAEPLSGAGVCFIPFGTSPLAIRKTRIPLIPGRSYRVVASRENGVFNALTLTVTLTERYGMQPGNAEVSNGLIAVTLNFTGNPGGWGPDSGRLRCRAIGVRGGLTSVIATRSAVAAATVRLAQSLGATLFSGNTVLGTGVALQFLNVNNGIEYDAVQPDVQAAGTTALADHWMVSGRLNTI